MLAEDNNPYICDVKHGKKCIVTIISDDGDFDTGIALNKIAEKFQLQFTIAGVATTINKHLSSWQQIINECHLEIVNHSFSHLRIDNEQKFNKADLYRELISAKKYFERNFSEQQFCFIPAENQITTSALDILKNHGVIAIRRWHRGFNALNIVTGYEPGEWFNLRTMGIRDVATSDERNVWVDTAIDQKKWLIEMWHNVTIDGLRGSYQEISVADAINHIQYIKYKEEDVWIAPFTSSVKYLYCKQMCELHHISEGNQIRIHLAPKATIEKHFITQLTCCINAPERIRNSTRLLYINDILIDKNTQDKFNMYPGDHAKIVFVV